MVSYDVSGENGYLKLELQGADGIISEKQCLQTKGVRDQQSPHLCNADPMRRDSLAKLLP